MGEVRRDPNGRFILLQALIDGWPVALVNVYAPTADRPDDQIGLLDELEDLLQDLDVSNLILGGDLNCCIDLNKDRFSRNDNSEANHLVSPRATLRLREFADELAVVDVWRLLHLDALQYTYRRKAYASRLDLWLVSEHLTELVQESEIHPATLSDHSAVSLVIQTVPTVRGPGLWRFDNSLLLEQTFVLAMNAFLQKCWAEDIASSPHAKWDLLKYKIRKFCIDYSRKAKSKTKERMESLARDLKTMEECNPSRCPDEEEVYLSKKKELADLELIRANKIIFRARANWAGQGERPNKFFLNLEKRRAKTNTLSQVMDEEGRLTSDPKEILNLTRSFYVKLYSEETPMPSSLDGIPWQNLDIPKVSEAHQERLEEAYSEKELHHALLKLHRGKAPGSDGLPADFCVKFWDFIKKPLLASLQYGLLEGELSVEQRRGVITLIPKKGVDRRHIRNWRPISLLNTDNKILTKAMSLCLQPVLNEILHGDQTGFLPKRYIGENLRTIQDVIDFTDESSTPALLLALDFHKAFDSIRWEFLFRAIQEFGFGNNFLDSVKTIFQNIESCTSNAGFTSNYFAPQRRVRQGCCVAPYLFLIAAEVLAIQIRQNPAVEGILVGDSEVKVTQFADDMTAFVRDESSALALFESINLFGSASGLRINRNKSQLLCLGPSALTSSPPLRLNRVDRVKILGLWFAPNRSINDHYEWNYKESLAKMRSTCCSWRNRNLSIKGKIAVVNFLVVSILHYVAANSALPPRVNYELKKMITHFIWNGGSPKIAYSTLIQPIERGGLKLADFQTRIRAARLMWIRRLVLTGNSFARDYVNYLAGNLGFAPLVMGKPRALPPRLKYSLFYSEAFELWQKYHGFAPSTEAEVRWEILWHNRRISIEGSSLNWGTWWSKGVLRVEDVLHPTEGRFLSHTEINEKYGLQTSFLDALQIRQSIPGGWRALVTPQGRPPESEGLLLSFEPGLSVDIFSSSSSSIYTYLIGNLAKIVTVPAMIRWPTSCMNAQILGFCGPKYQAGWAGWVAQIFLSCP